MVSALINIGGTPPMFLNPDHIVSVQVNLDNNDSGYQQVITRLSNGHTITSLIHAYEVPALLSRLGVP